MLWAETDEKGSLRESNQRTLALIHWLLPTLLDEHRNLQFCVKKILRKHRSRVQNQNLVQWGGYPGSWNSWEFELPLPQNCPYAVEVYERRVQGQLAIADASAYSV